MLWSLPRRWSLFMKSGLFLSASAVALIVMIGCGGGGTSSSALSGNYGGSIAGSGVKKGQTGSASVNVTPIGSTFTFSATIALTNPASTVTFSGTLTAADQSSQSFTAKETGGPYDGQTLQCGYNPNQPAQGDTQVYIYVPGSQKQSLYILTLTKSSTAGG